MTMKAQENQQIIICNSADEVARNAAKLFLSLTNEATHRKGRFSVALSGGSTPRATYELLRQPQIRDQIDWSKVHVFWSDEHFVPLDHPDSTYRMSQEALLSYVPIPSENIHPVLTDLEVETAAKKYQETIVNFFDRDSPSLDLILLGMGPDGHTASLFPDSVDVMAPADNLIAVIKDSPKPPLVRVSFTYKLINLAENVVFLVTGANKSVILKAVLEGPTDVAKMPAQGVRPKEGSLIWLVDESAAELLSL
jgi:6-phosphogluconolactonase